MSTLQVANIHLESTGNNRIQYDGSNTFTIAAGDANVAVVNSSTISINTDTSVGGTLSVNTNATIGGANVVTVSDTQTLTNKTINAPVINGPVTGNVVLSQATWETGTDTTEALVSPAKVAAAISSLVDAGSLLSVQVFTSSGTWTKPSGVNNVLVFVTGGGGGYNSGNISSGGGATAIKKINVSSISSATITVGGTGNQSSGGSSVWSDGTNTVTGGGGIYNGGGGTATGGDINLSGGSSYFATTFWGGYSYGTGGYIAPGRAGVVFVLEFT